MHSLHKRHLFIASLLLLTLVVNAGVAAFNIARLVANERAVARTYVILAQTEGIATLAREVENSARGFAATGGARFEESLKTAQGDLQTALDLLNRNISDPDQRLLLPGLELRVKRELEIAQRVLQIRRAQGVGPAQNYLARQGLKTIAQETRDHAEQIQGDEQDLLQERAEVSVEAAQGATRTFWIASLANILFLGVVLQLLWRASQQNAQLERAYADLQSAESLRDGLSAMLVHDLRTPLTTLLGPLQMMHAGAMGKLSAEQSELIGMSFHSGERLLYLINELLDISKMEAGELKISREAVGVPLLIEAARREVAPGDGKVAHLTIEIAPGLPPLCGEFEILVRVLINLLSNALKFTPVTGQVSLGAMRDADDPGFARFWVKDSGEGIPAEDLEKIFDKFGQVETRKAGRKMSTGLGLTFCKLAVETHGGKIWAESEVGQGSVFWFTIPLVGEDNQG